MSTNSEYPSWICSDCGKKYGRYPDGHIATFHIGVCGWCGETKAVTEPRDFRYPKYPGGNDARQSN